MARKLQIKRGLQANLPDLAQGELAMTVDSGNENIYIGTGTGENIEIARKSDVDALTAGVVGAVPTSRKINGKALTSDITLNNSDVGAAPTTHTHTKSQITDFPTSMTPTAHTHAADDITSGSLPIARGGTGSTTAANARTALGITPANIGAVPTSRTVNGKALSSNINLTATDVGAIGTSDLNAAKNEAAKTVLDLTTNKLVNINTNYEHFDSWRWTQAEGYINTRYSGDYGEPYCHMFRWGDSKVLFVGYSSVLSESSSYTYYCRYRLMNLATKAIITSWQYSINSDYYRSCQLSNSSSVSNDGSLVYGFAGSNQNCLIDIANNKYATINSRYFYGAYKTSSRWGYLYVSGYSDRRLYYADTGTTSFSNYYNLGNASNSSYYSIFPIGVYGNFLWLIEQNSPTEWKLSKIDVTTGTLTSGITTFNAVGNTYMYLEPIIHDGTKAYIKVQATISSTPKYCTKTLIVNMSDGTTNWSSINLSSNFVTDVNNLYNYTTYNYYIGSNSTSHFCGYEQGITEINRSSGAITLHQFNTSQRTYAEMALNGGKMVTFNLEGYLNLIPFGIYILDTNTKALLPILGKKIGIRSYNYVSGSWYGYDYPQVSSCGFGGTITTPEAVGLMGSGSTMNIIGSRIYSNISYITNI